MNELNCFPVQTPAPILTDRHKALAVRRITKAMRVLLDSVSSGDPIVSELEGWLIAAKRLKIEVVETDLPEGNIGRLFHENSIDQWVIQQAHGLDSRMKIRVVVHEIAHWMLRQMSSEWLCDEREVVYYYDGPVDDQRHLLARKIENRILKRS